MGEREELFEEIITMNFLIDLIRKLKGCYPTHTIVIHGGGMYECND